MPVYRVFIRGTVQGVGFRPFIKRLADREGLKGLVCNTGEGVVVDLVCEHSIAVKFSESVRREKPVLASIEECRIEPVAADTEKYSAFTIETSRPQPGAFTLVSPDIAVCADCLREMRDPDDRRFEYAFTNCTNCGPRYTIIRETPYDRANTTMAPFVMCAACAAEYADPDDRRFHAEPTACAVCGPRLSEPIGEIVDALAHGAIVAIKGLGGFQLACDALSEDACSGLRARKRRNRKPFALMMRNVATVERFCYVGAGERELLESRAAPIVLLRARDRALLPEAIAPGLDQIGVMLPYTPMHHQLFEGPLAALVMTSGNHTEEPIVIRNQEAAVKLSPLADRFLMHDRDIFMRADDSVTRWFENSPRLIRRARGYAPQAIDLGFDMEEALGVGGELKNTFCLTKGHYAIPSQHIGDFENLETQQFFEETLENLQAVYHASPKILGHDLHPDYLSTHWAMNRPEPKLAIQHHHAHVVSCMAENGLHDPVIGIAWDGTGYGSDGQIWGGEFLICNFDGFRRAAHFRYVPLIGGDRAAREGWRAAAAYLFEAFGDDYHRASQIIRGAASPAWWKTFDQLLRQPAIRTSSCGRLFDAVAALTNFCRHSSFEGEAAMLLEAAAAYAGEAYPFLIEDSLVANGGPVESVIDTRPMIRRIVEQCTAGVDRGVIAGAFHRTLAEIIRTVCLRLRDQTGLNSVCLSGGAFQNATLLSYALPLLRGAGFEVFQHSRVPANDGGLSLGQAVIAARRLAGGTSVDRSG